MSSRCPLTWTCHVCGKERWDIFISVWKTDLSAEYGLPPGTFGQNGRYCNDDPKCIESAKLIRFYEREARSVPRL
jgi:hypothetical protein